MTEPEGNHSFLAYVEDHDEPGTGIDRFWLEVVDKDEIVVLELTLGDTATEDAVTIEGENVNVPTGRGKKPR